jgi:hypothetical protein
VLQTRYVDALVEIARAIQQTDPDHRQCQIGGFLQDIAGQYAEPARVNGQRTVQTELGTAERDRMLRAGSTGTPGPGPVCRKFARQTLDALDARGVAGGAREHGPMRLGEQAPRIASATDPPFRIDRRERGGALGGPAPAIVVGHARERPQPLGKAVFQLGDGAIDVALTGKHDRFSSCRFPHATPPMRTIFVLPGSCQLRPGRRILEPRTGIHLPRNFPPSGSRRQPCTATRAGSGLSARRCIIPRRPG